MRYLRYLAKISVRNALENVIPLNSDLIKLILFYFMYKSINILTSNILFKSNFHRMASVAKMESNGKTYLVPSVTTDIAVFKNNNEQILMIKRGKRIFTYNPFQTVN